MNQKMNQKFIQEEQLSKIIELSPNFSLVLKTIYYFASILALCISFFLFYLSFFLLYMELSIETFFYLFLSLFISYLLYLAGYSIGKKFYFNDTLFYVFYFRRFKFIHKQYKWSEIEGYKTYPLFNTTIILFDSKLKSIYALDELSPDFKKFERLIESKGITKLT